jgi:hypothetical protein
MQIITHRIRVVLVCVEPDTECAVVALGQVGTLIGTLVNDVALGVQHAFDLTAAHRNNAKLAS